MTVVEFTNVTKSYRTHNVLKEMNFTIKQGVLTGIIGRNGVGKTTLMKLIVGFIEETSGNVEVFSEKPFNSLKVSANSILVDDGMNFPYPMTLTDILKECKRFYTNWDAGLRTTCKLFWFSSRMRGIAIYRKGKKARSMRLSALPPAVH